MKMEEECLDPVPIGIEYDLQEIRTYESHYHTEKEHQDIAVHTYNVIIQIMYYV